MTLDDLDGIGPILWGVTGYLSCIAAYKVDRVKKRTMQLQQAAELLEQHYSALDRFLSDPAATPVLSDFLLWFSDAAEDKRVAKELADCIRDYDRPSHGGDSQTSQEFRTLRNSRPDLAEAAEEAIGTGLYAMILRWDETAELFDAIAAKIGSNPNKEIALAAKAAQFEREEYSVGLVDDPALAVA